MIIAFIRTVILYFVLTVGLRLMGKRQIGELEPTELVITLLISDLASVPMQDLGIPLLNGLIPIAVLLSLSMLASFFNLKSIRFRNLVCGEPAVLIQNGKLCQKTMSKNRFTLDELLEQLRSQGIFDITAVKYAILETDGQLSVLPYSQRQSEAFPTLLINDGRIMEKDLRQRGLDEIWLQRTLQSHHISSAKEVFYLSVDDSQNITLIPREGRP